MHLTYLCSIMRSLRETIRNIDITEVVFCASDAETIAELFDEVEASEVFESLKIKTNVIDRDGSMCSVLTRSQYRTWGVDGVKALKDWLEDRRRGSRFYGWVEIRPNRGFAHRQKVNFSR